MHLKECIHVLPHSKRNNFHLLLLSVSRFIPLPTGSVRKRDVLRIRSWFVVAMSGHGFHLHHGEIEPIRKKNCNRSIPYSSCFRASLPFLCGVLLTTLCSLCMFLFECPFHPWFFQFSMFTSRPSSAVLIHFWQIALL